MNALTKTRRSLPEKLREAPLTQPHPPSSDNMCLTWHKNEAGDECLFIETLLIGPDAEELVWLESKLRGAEQHSPDLSSLTDETAESRMHNTEEPQPCWVSNNLK